MGKIIGCVSILVKCFRWLLDSNSEYFASVFCTGDTLILGGFLRAYRNQHSGKKIKVIIKATHRQIIDFYKDDIDEIMEVDSVQVLVVKIWFFYCSRYFHHMHYCLSERTLFHRDPDAVPRLASLGLLHCYKKSLSLLPETVFNTPDYPTDKEDFYAALKKKYGIEGNKVVVLAPYTVTLQKYDYIHYFERVAKELHKLGYTVFTNTIDKKYILGTIPLRTSFREIVALGQTKELWVISVRSGLCDLLYFTRCGLTVLYPTETDYQIFSLERMFGIRKGMRELIVYPDSRNFNRTLGEKP